MKKPWKALLLAGMMSISSFGFCGPCETDTEDGCYGQDAETCFTPECEATCDGPYGSQDAMGDICFYCNCLV